MPLPAAALIPMGIGLGKSIFGFLQGNKARKGLEELQNQPYPEFETGESIYGRADKMATGYSPIEKAYAKHNLNKLAFQRYRMGTDRNPTLSGAIQGATNYSSIQGTLGLAADDARLRRQSLGELISLLGGQSNMNTQSQIQKRIGEENAYGTAIQDQNANVFSGLTDIGNAGLAFGLNSMGDGRKTDWAKILGGSNLT